MAGPSLGERGERLAEQHLREAGWTIVARNFRIDRKEIDLVARRGEVVAFVEVKTRSGRGFGHPLESITPRKQAEILHAAHGWIERHGEPGSIYRFDAVSVVFARGAPPVVEHVEDAWRA